MGDARPNGYKMYLQLSAVVNKTASILLDSAMDDETSSDYKIGIVYDDAMKLHWPKAELILNYRIWYQDRRNRFLP